MLTFKTDNLSDSSKNCTWWNVKSVDQQFTVSTPYNPQLLKTKLLQKYSSHIVEVQQVQNLCCCTHVMEGKLKAYICRKIKAQTVLEAKQSYVNTNLLMWILFPHLLIYDLVLSRSNFHLTTFLPFFHLLCLFVCMFPPLHVFSCKLPRTQTSHPLFHLSWWDQSFECLLIHSKFSWHYPSE